MSATLIKYIFSGITGLLIVCPASITASTTHEQQLFKLDLSGSRLNESAVEWSCVEDASTGLFWQKRDPSNALHNHASYTWYQPNHSNSGSQLSYINTSHLNVTCDGYRYDDPNSYCNTDAYIKRVNQTNYCGYSDWRLPTAVELISLSSPKADNSHYTAEIDLEYFPFHERFVYWTDSVTDSDKVMTIASEIRALTNAERTDQLSVRLVRGTQY